MLGLRGPRMAALGAALALASIAGCHGGVTSIKTLLDDPSRFDKTTVRVAGTVGASVGVMGYGGYQIDDGTGTLTIIAQGTGAPREGAKVGSEGEFRSAYTLGTQSGAVLLEKKRFTP
ncbi:MAG: hypothetical protein E6K78_06015 [Candidatus Eisenbacteria bacterium]|uniref:Uncharacterized protein n=1 Tax=Eiseniibacteriota bacterium TaxID=2212470 RepID=A0A538TTB6_UNCEI|nr:MAG: hypothetical protein E6K78_06015 [Candidatus Eisenbacteria bacterium]